MSRIIALVGVLLAACSTLQPVQRVPDFSTRTDNPLWARLRALQPADWQLPLNYGPDALDWRLRAIDSASGSIDLQTFLWSLDTTGTLMLDHLMSAAQRGVMIRLLIDDTFLAGQESLLLALAEHPNIEYRIFNPFLRRYSDLAGRQILNLSEFRRLDHRMHNKAMIVDREVAIVGGRNLADEYFGLSPTANFRDMELMIGGPAVGDVADAFDLYWNNPWTVPVEALSHVEASAIDLSRARSVLETAAQVHGEETAQVRSRIWSSAVSGAFGGRARLFIDPPPGADPSAFTSAPVQVADDLIALIDDARTDITIVSAYLIPTPRLEGAIERAVERGVSVKILTNSLRSNNHTTAHSAYRRHIRKLMSHGAALHEVKIDARDRDFYILPPVDMKPLALHAKVLIIDSDKVFIGSANLDPRSLRINTEMGLLVTSESLNRELRSAVAPDFSLPNAWKLVFGDKEEVLWVSDSQVLDRQPADSFMLQIEDWFFSLLPIEGEL